MRDCPLSRGREAIAHRVRSYDVRYVVRAGANETFVIESVGVAPMIEAAADESLDASLRRMACKWLAR